MPTEEQIAGATDLLVDKIDLDHIEEVAEDLGMPIMDLVDRNAVELKARALGMS